MGLTPGLTYPRWTFDSSGNPIGLSTPESSYVIPVEVGRCLVRRAAALVIPTNTVTAVPFDTVGYDNLSTLGVDTTQIIIPSGVSYASLTGNALFPADINVGSCRLTAHLNGAAFDWTPAMHVPSNGDTTDTSQHLSILSPRFPVVAGDYLQMKIRHTKGADSTFANGGGCWFEVCFFSTP